MNIPITTTPERMPTVIAWPTEALALMTLCRELSKARSLPQWCQQSPADLFFGVQSLLRASLDPFMSLRHISMIRNNLFFDGQLCGAILNNSGKLASNLSYEYIGEDDDRTVTVRARLVNETEPRELRARLGDVRNDANANWKNNPDQQLSYWAARNWARRNCPEVLMGFRFRDEAEEMKDVTPPKEPVSVQPPPMEPPTAKGDRFYREKETATTAETTSDEIIPFQIARDGDSAEDWSSWGTTFVAYVRAAKTVDRINDWINVNSDELATLLQHDTAKYRKLVDITNHEIAKRDESDAQ